MNAPGDGFSEKFRQQGQGEFRPAAVKRREGFTADSLQSAVFQIGRHQSLAQIVRTQGGRGHHAHDGTNDIRARNDNAGARSGQPDLGQAHGQDHVLIPGRGYGHKTNIGQRRPVSIVNHQGNPGAGSHFPQKPQFFIRHHVPGGIRRPGHADGGRFRTYVQTVKINHVLERVPVQHAYAGPDAPEHDAAAQGLGLVSHIIRAQGKKDFTHSTVRTRARQHVEQCKAGHLAALGNRHIFRRQVPSATFIEKTHQGTDEGRIPARMGIMAHQHVKFAISHQFLHAASPKFRHFRNNGGAPAVQLAQACVSRMEGLE